MRRYRGAYASSEQGLWDSSDLAHNLGLAVIAEGVENESTLNMLRGMGCDLAQGYHISRPLPVGDFNRYLHGTDWKVQKVK
jgi:EAL domain-containing protein (putative c-di-GMP-specific phosphodiesterase class I)